MSNPQVTAVAKRPEPVNPPIESITLTMDLETATVLKVVAGSVAGINPLRKRLDAVYNALADHIPFVWDDYAIFTREHNTLRLKTVH